jgi:hypothetical protein
VSGYDDWSPPEKTSSPQDTYLGKYIVDRDFGPHRHLVLEGSGGDEQTTVQGSKHSMDIGKGRDRTGQEIILLTVLAASEVSLQ